MTRPVLALNLIGLSLAWTTVGRLAGDGGPVSDAAVGWFLVAILWSAWLVAAAGHGPDRSA